MLRLTTLLALLTQTADVELARIEDWAKTQPDNGPGRVGVGDEYFRAAKKFPKDRPRFLDRANEAWASGWPLLDVVWREKTRESLRRIYAGPQFPSRAPTGWTAGQFVKADVCSAAVRSGVAALRIVPLKTNSGLAEAVKISIKIQPGKEHVFSFWSLSDGTDGAETSVLHVCNQAGKEVATQVADLPRDTPVWTPVRWTFMPPDTADRADFIFLTSSKTGVTFLDDVSLKVEGREFLQNGGFEK